MTDYFQLNIYYGETLGTTVLLTKEQFRGIKTDGKKSYFIWNENGKDLVCEMTTEFKRVVDTLIIGQKIVIVDLLYPSETENAEEVKE